MRKIMIPALLSLGLSVMLVTNAVHAAPVEDVVAACDRMDAEKPGSCSYTVDSGGLHGCTANGCFTCPVDGSRQCYPMRTSGKRPHLELGTIKMKCEPVINGWCKQALESKPGSEPKSKSAGR